jgi:hypothetical protein
MADGATGSPRLLSWHPITGVLEFSPMHLLALVMVTLAVAARAQQLSCDVAPEQELPNCHFTVRSNYALHGRVHTVRVMRQELSPDPRPPRPNTPTLSIQEPGVWVVFSPDGDIIENAGRLSPDGSPLDPTSERTMTAGSKTIVISGTAGDPESFRREESFAPDGTLIEEVAYQHENLLSRYVHGEDSTTGSIEDTTYDADGNEISHSTERSDKRGRVVETIVFNLGRLVLHICDSYDETSDGDPELISRAWFDKNCSRFREIMLRHGEAVSWWQRPNCDELCQPDHGVGLNFAFEHSVYYEFQPGGSLLTTIQHHKGLYGNIDNDDVERLNQDGKMLEKIAYRYVRDKLGNWTERTASVLDPATGQMVDVRLDKRDLTYY